MAIRSVYKIMDAVGTFIEWSTEDDFDLSELVEAVEAFNAWAISVGDVCADWEFNELSTVDCFGKHSEGFGLRVNANPRSPSSIPLDADE